MGLCSPAPMAMALVCLLAYLIGGVPFGLVIVRLWKGIDIRTIGSGNVGATNASRVFSERARIPVFLTIYLLDFLKGLVPALVAPLVTPEYPLLASVLAGSAAILGHCFPPWLRFRGGKGVATANGVAAAVAFLPLVLALGVFLLVVKVTRHVWIGSLCIAVTLPIMIWLTAPSSAFQERLPVMVFGLAVGALILVTHRSNIRKALSSRAASGTAS